MRYHLALIPDRGDGQPDYDMNPIPLKLLPEGTRKLTVDAHWSIDGPARTFKGGTEGFVIDIEEEKP